MNLWGEGKYQRTIPLGRDNNVATFSLAPGYSNFEAFCVEADLLDSIQDPIALPSGIIGNDDEEPIVNIRSNDEADMDTNTAAHPNGTLPTPIDDDSLKTTAAPIEFNLDGPLTSALEGGKAASTSGPNVIIDKEDRQPSHLAELLRMYHQYGHISMRKLQEMVKQGTIPKRLVTYRIPTCSACLYSKATKRPWRGKESKRGDGKQPPARPGQVISVDQLVSPTPGLIAHQMTGFLTTKRYTYYAKHDEGGGRPIRERQFHCCSSIQSAERAHYSTGGMANEEEEGRQVWSHQNVQGLTQH